MQGQVILVTGSAGDVGSKIVQYLLRRGATVAGVSRSGAQTVQGYPEFLSVAADLSSAAGAATAVSAVVEHFGKIDGMVHTVGGFSFGALHELPEEEWKRLVNWRKLERRLLLPARGAAADCAPSVPAESWCWAALPPPRRTRAFPPMWPPRPRCTLWCRPSRWRIAISGLPSTQFCRARSTRPSTAPQCPKQNPSRWLSPQKIALLCAQLIGDEEGTITGALLPLEK